MLMSDEKYEYITDCKEKAITARSARNRKGNTGKGGPVQLPSDFLTKKQREAMNGECKTYRLGSPMSWAEFSEMPNDLKKMYIKKLRKKYDVPDAELALSMDVGYSEFADWLRAIKLSPKFLGKDGDWYATDYCDSFRAWWVLEEK